MSKQIQRRASNKSLGGGNGKPNRVNLSVPWSDLASCTLHEVLHNSLDATTSDTISSFVRERTRLHEIYIREQEKTKRVGLILAAIMILGAASLVLFAPQGRETLSYWIGTALVIFAAGAVGYRRLWSKTNGSSFGADQDQNNLPSS